MTTNVFNSQDDKQQGSDQNHQQQQNTQDVNVFADQLSTITNEQGEPKYGTVDKALEALKHSQDFIPTLQAEKLALEEQVRTLSEQVAQSKGVQDVLSELSNQREMEQEAHKPQQSFTAEDVNKLVEQQLNQRSQADMQKANAKSVHEALVSQYGTEAQAMVTAKAKELGTTPEQLGMLASESPKMVLTLFGNTTKQAAGTTTSYNFDTTPQQKERLTRPDKSLMFGATSKETTDFMKQIRDEVYEDFDVKE